MSEQVLFDEGGVFISNNRVVSGGKTYSVRSITSVAGSEESGAGGVVIIMFGIVFWLFASVVAGALANILLGPQARDTAFFIVMLLSLGIIIYGIKEMVTSRYYIHLNMMDRHEVLLITEDAKYHRRVLRAINDAIAVQR